MSFVATLICNPVNPALDSTIVDGARAVLPSPGSAQWLFDEVAVDIPFEGHDDIKAIEHRLREARGDLPVDIVVQPRAFRRKKLFLADMDSTMIGQECIDELADFAGLKAHVAGITERAMRGEIEYDQSLRERLALLKGLDESALQRVYDERLQLSPGAETLLAAARAAGVRTLLVSGGFTFFTERLKPRLALDYTAANTLEVADGKLTGRVLGDIVDAQGKADRLNQVRLQLNLDKQQVIAMGDGANDLKMMAEAGVSIAYRAKPVVRAQASYALNQVGLDGVIPLLGGKRMLDGCR